ncbi:putative holin-like toxin [Enterococcus faecalis]|nr:putative holin-like toxin [Enterococcus faecalis]EGO2680147.1 putative holin-like toxin [Enterococcus faecalis]EKZ0223930.1 putative holin-like toxin [Enterococcus faecalis]MCD4912496.1 putative holin-like toxin [Enterococcus faecalis]HAP3049983.1 putative holin-like toxin [Enterococcus faecalis]HEC4825817.1 putative holin-like toxin [Enterococcus faecalis]
MKVSAKIYERRSLLTVFEALSLMIAFATLVLLLNDKNNKK